MRLETRAAPRARARRDAPAPALRGPLRHGPVQAAPRHGGAGVRARPRGGRHRGGLGSRDRRLRAGRPGGRASSRGLRRVRASAGAAASRSAPSSARTCSSPAASASRCWCASGPSGRPPSGCRRTCPTRRPSSWSPPPACCAASGTPASPETACRTAPVRGHPGRRQHGAPPPARPQGGPSRRCGWRSPIPWKSAATSPSAWEPRPRPLPARLPGPRSRLCPGASARTWSSTRSAAPGRWTTALGLSVPAARWCSSLMPSRGRAARPGSTSTPSSRASGGSSRTYSSSLADQREVYRLLVTRRLDPSPLVTHRLPLSRFDEAVDLARERRALKVLLTPDEELP